MIDNQQKQGAEPMKVKDAMNMFAFRYSLCVLIHTLAWIGEGASRGKKLEKRVNDAIDLQVVAVGTFFEGAFSGDKQVRSEEHTSELQSLMRISYAVFCLKKKK